MRVASDNDWIKLSEWKKFKIKDDTLYFETFGEWSNRSKAKIEYVGNNKVQLHFPKPKEIIHLETISENIIFKKNAEFWHGFHNRQNSENCIEIK
ncbi:hypothetical protein [Aureibaculum conchae]|uniref:hypothetical protein n=1 Tax=Aureibaculum sp. 2308TA14-22 TaxID=3108392 RepID=UPI003395774A